jgi:uncharacterized protein (DUF1697 family)
MTVFVAMLRAVNVGGTGKLPMSELIRACEAAGFEQAKTYIQSGNVVFKSRLAEAKVQAKLAKALETKLKKPATVLVRTATELDAVIAGNPFARAAPNQLLIMFLARAPAHDALASLRIPGSEQLRLLGRELFIHFPDGMGRSKLKVPLAELGTGRNLNTVLKLAALAHALEDA